MSVNFHFLNVGPGDCTIVHFPSRTRNSDNKHKDERIMMVDTYQSLDYDYYEDILEYYKRNFQNAKGNYIPIFRFICTHPHQDHICGLNEIFSDSDIRISNFWDLEHDWHPEDLDKHPTHEDDWNTYQTIRKSENGPRVIRTFREDEPMVFWNDDEDRITILAPSKKLIQIAHYKEDGIKRKSENIEIDEMSYTLLIKINDRKVILASDGRKSPHWDDIYENCSKDIKDCAILKAPHHGHLCGLHEDALKLINPHYIIFSNSEEEDLDNGAEKEYRKILPNSEILKTWELGSILIRCPFSSSEEIEVIVNH